MPTIKSFLKSLTKYSRIIAAFLLLTLPFTAPSAFADQSPAECQSNDFDLTLSRSTDTAYDDTTPLGPTTITYTVSAGNPNDSGDGCDVTDVDIDLITPDGAVHSLQTGGNYPIGTPVSPIGSVNYDADSSDLNGNVLETTTTANGILHDISVNSNFEINKGINVLVINPDTNVSISTSADTVYEGDQVDLTITETNTGDADLSNVYIYVQPLGNTYDETDPEFTGVDVNGDGILSPGETWEWTITGVTVNSDTTYEVYGHGLDELENDISYQNNFTAEYDSVDVDVIAPTTITTISSSSTEVLPGDTVDLTVTEENDGDVDLTNPYVDVDNGVGTLSSPPDSGDTDADGELDVGETWSWIESAVVNSTTTFTATGHGTDPLGTDITYPLDQDEQDSVRVLVVNPSTDVTISSNLAQVHAGDTVDLTIMEENDGTGDLTSPYVDLQPLGYTLDKASGYYVSGDADADGELDSGETWTWVVNGVTVNSDETYTAVGHGMILGVDVTYCEDPQSSAEGVFCDQDEMDTVDVDTIDPSTMLTIEADKTTVDSGEEVILTITETNDGDDDLTDPYVELEDNSGLFATLTPPPDSGDSDTDGILDAGESWVWTVSVFPTEATTYTATGFGTDSLGVEVTFPDDPEEQDDVIVEVIEGCTLTQGYWKTHSEMGPAPYDEIWAMLPSGANTEFFSTGMSWYEVFHTSPKGNAYYNLAHQYMAAELNMYANAGSPTEVSDAISGAESLFSSYNPDDIDELKGNDPLRKEFLEYAETLGSYNEGLIGPGHCE